MKLNASIEVLSNVTMISSTTQKVCGKDFYNNHLKNLHIIHFNVVFKQLALFSRAVSIRDISVVQGFLQLFFR